MLLVEDNRAELSPAQRRCSHRGLGRSQSREAPGSWRSLPRELPLNLWEGDREHRVRDAPGAATEAIGFTPDLTHQAFPGRPEEGAPPATLPNTAEAQSTPPRGPPPPAAILPAATLRGRRPGPRRVWGAGATRLREGAPKPGRACTAQPGAPAPGDARTGRAPGLQRSPGRPGYSRRVSRRGSAAEREAAPPPPRPPLPRALRLYSARVAAPGAREESATSARSALPAAPTDSAPALAQLALWAFLTLSGAGKQTSNLRDGPRSRPLIGPPVTVAPDFSINSIWLAGVTMETRA
ncbi:PREDICTED: translation initiation factor IF-2-like [Chinchilla lanigera]|uniref:translation initiation factor IF-2-like n=1 Tax=Chinchilla lanigera TaxID=34839 RepID=UPI000696EC38|nr:PREDICTED: translation initiation factor IF-2-like [Chinchilla lanigera]